MRTKKLLALLMAAVMLVGLVPLAALSEGEAPAAPEGEALVEKTADDKGGERAHESYFNTATSGTYLNYVDTGDHAWVDKYNSEGEYYYLESGNAGQSSTSSTMTLSRDVRMYAGEYLEFQYWYSTEENYDKFTFSVNGSVQVTASGESNGWQSYRYTIPSEGLYNFEWTYRKDGSLDGGSDCVRLAYCTYSGHYDDYRNMAGLAAGGGGLTLNTPSDASYGFWVKSSTSADHPLYLMSSNYGVNYSSCIIESTALVPQDANATYTIEFDYAVSCEATHDNLCFYVDGTEVFQASGYTDYSWKHYSYTLSSGQHHLKWRYYKDGSIMNGNDVACLDNIKIVGYDNAWDRYLGFEDHGLAYDNNAQLIFNTPKGAEGFDTVTMGFLINNNRFIDESTSYFETYITMAQGETLSFDYLVSSESYDYFRFKVDGTTKVYASGWENPQVLSYTFTAPSTKTYLMRWEYEKDESISRGYDMAAVLNILYNGTYLTDLTADDIDDMLNDEMTDYHLSFIGGAGVGGSPNGWDGVISSNMYYEDSNSSIGAPCYMNAGDMLSFEYYVDGEDGCDYLEFHAEREISSGSYDEMDYEYWSDSDGWNTYTFTCETAGYYWFGWDYKKDYSVNEGRDIAMLDNVRVERSNLLMQALNPDGMDEEEWIWFDSTGEYCFEPIEFEGRFCARSNNHSGSTEAVLTGGEMIGVVNDGAYISFDYYVSSEKTYDYLVFYVNGSEIARFSGTDNPGWHTFVTPNRYSGWTEFTWKYHKDGNLSYGQDLAAVDNVQLLYTVGLMGDADGNGMVNANDALLILRYSLGIISSLACPENCDVDGNGSINANDALMVLRYALGIISSL